LHGRRPDIHLSLHIPEKAFVQAHPDFTGVLLENLLANAAAYTPADGEMAVVLKVRENTWQLHISNTVTELGPDDLNHLFEPFWRKSSDRSDSSHTGLGLALVSECARLMQIELQASLPTATTFC